MLRIEHITKSYGKTTVLDDISYRFEDTYVYGLVGRNGAGKTTFLNAISNFDRSYSGELYYGDRAMGNMEYLQMPVAYAMDSPSFFNELTVYENLLLIISARNLKKEEAIREIDKILDSLEIQKYRDYLPLELSKGTLQRLNNACAMIQKKEITLFDEPFSGLDPVQIRLLEHTIKEFHNSGKGLIIISSHDIECLQNICDRCILLKNGTLIDIEMNLLSREKIASLLSEEGEYV